MQSTPSQANATKACLISPVSQGKWDRGVGAAEQSQPGTERLAGPKGSWLDGISSGPYAPQIKKDLECTRGDWGTNTPNSVHMEDPLYPHCAEKTNCLLCVNIAEMNGSTGRESKNRLVGVISWDFEISFKQISFINLHSLEAVKQRASRMVQGVRALATAVAEDLHHTLRTLRVGGENSWRLASDLCRHVAAHVHGYPQMRVVKRKSWYFLKFHPT